MHCQGILRRTHVQMNVERGTHANLLQLEGPYHDLYTRQHGLEENLFLAPGEGDTQRI